MNTRNTLRILSSSFVASAVLASSNAFALDQITRPYWSARSGGMGGVRITTGLYDENFFNNPARVTANPRFRFTLLDPMVEGSSNLPDTVDKLAGSGDIVEKFADTAGENNHGRIQMTLPSVYFGVGKWNFAIGLITSTQFDVDLRQNFQLEPTGTLDLGPAVTVGRKLLDEDRLSVGATGHVTYRMQTNKPISFLDLLKGNDISPLDTGGQGAMIDFDLGATYRLPVGEGSPFRYHVGAAVNNLLGGGYDNLGLELVSALNCAGGGKCLPGRQPRTLGVGLSATRESWWKLADTTIAIEATDMGNNTNGSFYRVLHLGAETHWSVLALRAGVNQGYLTAGLGLDLRFFTVDVATYGEEMSLNPGGLQDRRYALKIALQI